MLQVRRPRRGAQRSRFAAALTAGLAASLAASCADPAAPSQTHHLAVPLSATIDKDSVWIADTTVATVHVAPTGLALTHGVADATWRSSDSTVASVSSATWDDSTVTAIVTGRGSGRATLTATVRLRDSSTGTATTTVVVRAAQALAVWADTNALLPGVVRQLDARDVSSLSPYYSPAAGVRWVSDAPDVATVDDVGRVTAHAAGHATVTAVRTVPGSGDQRANAVVVVRTYPTPLAFTSVVTAALAEYGGFPYAHTCGITRDGRAYCWGDNSLGSLGTSDVLDRCETPVQTDTYGHSTFYFRRQFRCSATPVEVSGNHRFTQLSAYHWVTCGVTMDGAIYCWGATTPLDGGTAADPTVQGVPRLVSTTIRFQQVAVGDRFACALDAAGAAYCWGRNEGFAFGLNDMALDAETPFFGLLGTGSTDTLVSTPQPVLGGLRFVRVAAGPTHVCAVTASGEAWCWGENNRGELGNGRPMTDRCASAGDTTCFAFALRPMLVQGGLTFREVRTGSASTCGLTSTNSLWCWGEIDAGRVEQRPMYYRATVGRVPVPMTQAPAYAALTSPPQGGEGSSPTQCGLGLDGLLSCFADASTPPSAAVPGYTFEQAAGPGWPYFGAGGCGVGRDGVTSCWYSAVGGARGDGTIVTEGDPGGSPARVAGQR
ncbi:hypothetical protein tb265_23910 [Gemmatimonadetes bacterium T265]|nr:hypothetical protein tb265_23910 [Gemmatimonadetes bacterium T265]